MEQNYYIGLDIGTNSVGWAVTDEKYNLVKAPVKGRYKNHDMWGIRLFESANTAAERRVARSNRRRGQRKVRRIKLLQELFAEEMNKVDPTFFIRLNESRLHPEDKSEILQEERHLLFIGNEEAEKEYYEKYPTIYHLRKDLIDDAEPHDIRLVYLALHHIIKNRGHFLREGSFSDAVDFDVPFGYMIGTFDNMGIQLKYNDKNVVKSILSDRALNNSDKQKKLMEQFELNLSQDATAELDSAAKAKKEKVMLTEITRLMVGNKGTLSKIFEDIPDDVDGTKTDVKLSEEKYETEIPVIVAGGIFDGKDISHALELGADGVQIASRFVATEECDASEAYKQAYIHADEKDVQIIQSPVGMPGRALRNRFIEHLEKAKMPISKCYNCLEKCNPARVPYCITKALIDAVKGDVDNGLVFCGANVGRIHEMTTVHALMQELLSGI